MSHRHETLFQAAVFEKDWGRAEQIAKEMLQIDPENVLWKFNCALALLSLGKNQRAISTLSGVPNGADDLQKWTILSFVYAQFGQYELAQKTSVRIPRFQ